MIPPAPSRMRSVLAATWAMSTLVADDAIDGMLWCSAYQIRWNPSVSACCASTTVASRLSRTVCWSATIARSRMDNWSVIGVHNGDAQGRISAGHVPDFETPTRKEHPWKAKPVQRLEACGPSSPSRRGPTRGPEIEFDFIDHVLEVRTTDGARRHVALEPRWVADFYAATLATVTPSPACRPSVP